MKANRNILATFSLIAACAVLSLPRISFGQAGEDLPRFSGGILVVGQAPVAGTDEIQTLTIGGTPSGGTFVITFEGRASAAITWVNVNATLVSNIDAALEAMPNIGTGGVTTAVGTMTAGVGTITLTFTGNRAKENVALAVVSNNSMTGSSPTAVIATTTPGVTADGRTTPKGQLLIDVANGILYINTGTPLAPTWTKVGTQT